MQTKEDVAEEPKASSAAEKLERLHLLMDQLGTREREVLSAVVAAGVTGIRVSVMAKKYKVNPISFGGITRSIRAAASEVGIDPDHALQSVHSVEGSGRQKRRSGTTIRSKLGVDVEQTPRDEVQAVLDKIRTNTTKSAFMAIVEAGLHGIESSVFAKKIGLKTNGEGIGPVLHAIRVAARKAGVDPLTVISTKGASPMVVSTRLVMSEPGPGQKKVGRSSKMISTLTVNESKILRLLTYSPQTVEVLAAKAGMGVVTLANVTKKLADKRLVRFFPGLGYKL